MARIGLNVGLVEVKEIALFAKEEDIHIRKESIIIVWGVGT